MHDSKAAGVLITGASGNIGSKVCAALQSSAGYRVVPLDRSAAERSGIIAADLRRYSESWRQHFTGVRVVVHLAGNPLAHDAWPRLVEDNIDATINIYEAAVAAGVQRVVFASSLHAALRDAELTGASSATRLGNPDNFYGATKALGERLGKSYAEKYGLSVICLRLGMVRRGDNAPPRHHHDIAVQRRWLSNADLCRAVECAVAAKEIEFGVCNVTSRVEGSPWELDSARVLLGYEPQDTYTPIPPTLTMRLRSRFARLARNPK